MYTHHTKNTNNYTHPKRYYTGHNNSIINSTYNTYTKQTTSYYSFHNNSSNNNTKQTWQTNN